jgi:lysyl-tRNA synthetase, class II
VSEQGDAYDPGREEQEHRRVRLEKLAELERRGVDAFPMRVERTHTAAEAVAAFRDEEGAEPVEVTVTGRIVGQIRDLGKLVFARVADGTGSVQLMCQSRLLGDEQFDLLKRLVDPGDFVQACGRVVKTKTGEISVQVEQIRLISKALRPLPDKWHGLTDPEKRYRQRYLDLIANDRARQTLLTRSRIVASLRRFLEERGFVEVETPVLHPVYGGASARPFETYHNALERKLYLRIALELYLKRLIVGGIDKVYEIGRNFRNEGVDRQHNPEFTMLETYEAYVDYRQVMEMAEQMVASVARDVLGRTTIQFREHEIELRPPWRRLPMREAILEFAGVDFAAHRDAESLREAARAAGLPVTPDWSRGKTLDELVSNFVEPRLIQPTFLVDYPVDFPGSTLAKRQPDDRTLVERFEGYVGGMEICNAFTELNDPRDQRARFEEQVAAARAGEDDAHPMDEDYVVALEHGMPPTGGLGMGIDRLAMVLTDQPSIREVIFFPHLRETDD